MRSTLTSSGCLDLEQIGEPVEQIRDIGVVDSRFERPALEVPIARNATQSAPWLMTINA